MQHDRHDPTMRPALLIALAAALTLAAVWAFELNGYPPCELCLLQRDPFYVGVPLALATAAAIAAGSRGLGQAGYAALGLLFLLSAGLGAYHAGVEWQFWAGPSGCTGALTAPAAIDDFLKQLATVKVVRCDAAALRIGGLSLAGWNVVASLALAALSGFGWQAAQATRITGSRGRTVPPSRTLA